MSFEDDNSRIIECIVHKSGEIALDIRSDRGWYDPQLMVELGEENFEELEERLSNPFICRILEIGCGQGETLRDLRKQFPHLEYHGIDIALQKFTERPTKGVYLHEMDAQKLDFPEEYFDIVFSVIAFPYIVDKLRGMREAYRVLKTNGKGIITLDPSYFSPSGEILIPSESGASAVFWDKREKAVIIDKKGGNISALEREYNGYELFEDADHYLYSVRSHYR